ncbi:FecR family protein [Sphingobacterium sp. MYb382]|uniref:FecR family protein n=1 Tax=Sphingobacterium sp. MYb382 TaxID=2745278 RepID=UPI0030AEFE46
MKEKINYLLTQYFNNKSTPEELEELFDLFNSANHDSEIERFISEKYEALKREVPSLTYVDDDGVLRDAARMPPASVVKPMPQKRRSTKLVMVGSLVACLALVWGTWFAWNKHVEDITLPKVEQVVRKSAHDENKLLTLADGTKVWLNASSRLEYPTAFEKGNPREVTLIGEAYFEVEKAKDWPFIIHTADVQTKVLGTKFNIKAYPGFANITVSVKSGKVSVSRGEKLLATLLKNQEFEVSPNKPSELGFLKEKELETKVAGSWKDGYLEYEDESLKSIAADLERNFNIRILFKDSIMADKVITLSVLREEDPAHVMDVLSRLIDAHIKKEQNNYTIY